MIAGLTPPEGWRERDDANDLLRAVARLAYAEAEVLRVQDRLRASAPAIDHWEALYDWSDDAYTILSELGQALQTRNNMAEGVQAILIRWHDQDRKPVPGPPLRTPEGYKHHAYGHQLLTEEQTLAFCVSSSRACPECGETMMQSPNPSGGDSWWFTCPNKHATWIGK